MLYFIGSGFLIQPDSSGCEHSASDLEYITERIIENRTPFILLVYEVHALLVHVIL